MSERIKYIATYYRHGELLHKEFFTAKGAAQFLLDGEKKYALSWVSVEKGKNGGTKIAEANLYAQDPYKALEDLGAKE